LDNKGFAHLHIHNEYSQLDGYGSAKQYVDRAKEMGFKWLALTNHGNISGCLKFQKECDKQGIKPILGCEAYIVPDAKKRVKEKAAHIVILAKNMIGWQALCRILTYSNLEGFFNQKPRIDYESILNSDLSGWIILTGCLGSFLTLKGGEEFFVELIKRMRNRLYLEIMPHNEDIQKEYHEKFIKPIRDGTGLPYVATNDAHYILRNERKAQDALLAVQRKAKWNDPNRWKFTFRNLHLRSEKEMYTAFARQGQFTEDEVRAAMHNTVGIARICQDFRIPKQEISLPRAPGTKEKDPAVILYDLCLESLTKLFGESEPKWKICMDRFDYEFNLITSKKFEQYFLIVRDIIQWCNENDIMVGPGRGSVGGSLIAYLLGITKTDPIKFDLSFERFISADRIDWPDIDIDFEANKRDLVVQYIEDTYGKNNVCGISTDTRMKSKAVLRDIGRVFQIPEKDVSAITQAVKPDDHEKAVQICFDEDETEI